MLKVTEHRGTQMVNGKEMEFENTLIRHSTPTEIRLKLFDTMTKAEQHYASLLKQKESLLVTALSIMRKLNIKFSREAGQMVVAAHEAKVIAEAHDSKPLPLETGYVIPAHILDKAQEEAKAFQALDSHIEDGVTVHRITKEDLKKAHELNEQAVAEQIYAERPEEKPLMIDDDW